jgi:hypothetical protein
MHTAVLTRFTRLVAATLAGSLLLTACVLPPRKTPPPPGPAPSGPAVGYLGCSNTEMAVQGYHDVAGTGRFWPALPYGGGSLDQWTDPASHYWTTFSAELAVSPVDRIWWHLCLHPGTTLAQAQTVLGILRSKVAATPVFASAMATYASPTECTIADPADSQAILTALLAAGQVQQGPLLTPLSPANTTDGCHPDQATRDADGQSLHSFFG